MIWKILVPGEIFLRYASDSWEPTPENFRARKTIFSSFASKNGEEYKPETSCMKGASVHFKTLWIKQLCNRKVAEILLWLCGPDKIMCCFRLVLLRGEKHFMPTHKTEAWYLLCFIFISNELHRPFTRAAPPPPPVWTCRLQIIL